MASIFIQIQHKVLAFLLPIFFWLLLLTPTNLLAQNCVNPADLTNNTLEVCFGEEITFCPEDGEDICYKWLSEETFLLGESVFPSPTTLPILEDVEIQLIKTDNNGNILENTTINIIVNDFGLDISEIHEIFEGQNITLEVNPLGGSGNYTYSWNTGEISSAITISPTETTSYNVEIQDVDLGCSLIVSQLVIVNPCPDISIESTYATICEMSMEGLSQKSSGNFTMPPDCEQQSTTLSVSSNSNLNGYSYEWSTGEVTPSIDVSEVGEYLVTIISNDCVSTAIFELKSCFEVNIEQSIVFSGSEPQTILDAGEGNSYLWHNGSTEQTVELTELEDYSVTVTNDAGCTTVAEYTPNCNYHPTLGVFLCVYEGIESVELKSKDFLDCGRGPGYLSGGVGSSGINYISDNFEFSVDGSTHTVKITIKEETGNINLENYEIDFTVNNTEIKFGLFFRDADDPSEIFLRFEATNFGDIEALITFLSCYQDWGISNFKDSINAELDGEDDCDKLDVILASIPIDFIKEQIDDNTKIQYIEILTDCGTCNFGVDERAVLVKLSKSFNGYDGNQLFYNYLKDNPEKTIDINQRLNCFEPGTSQYAKEFGSIVNGLCHEYWEPIVDNSTEWINIGEMGGYYSFFDGLKYTIDAEIGLEISNESEKYTIWQEMTGPIFPDFFHIYATANNLRNKNEFEIDPLDPVRIYDVNSDIGIYVPAIKVFNMTGEDSYESFKNDAFNTLTLLGIGSSLKIATLANSTRMMKLVGVVEAAKLGIVDQVFNIPGVRAGIAALDNGNGADWLEVWSDLSLGTDLTLLVLGSANIFTRLDETSDEVVTHLRQKADQSSGSTAEKYDKAADAVEAIGKAAKLIDQLKALYPVLNGWNKLDELAGLANAVKLLNQNLANKIKEITDLNKQLELFDDIVSNSVLIDKFADNSNLVNAWKVLYHQDIPIAIRIKDSNLNFVEDYLKRNPADATTITNGIKNATNKQNWLDLFELEDVAKVNNLAKNNIIKFTILEEVSWSKDLVSDLVNELKAIKLDIGETFGRFDEIKIDVVTISATNPFPDINAVAAVESFVFPNGTVLKNVLKINTAYINRWDDYSEYLADIENLGQTNQIVAHNLRDVLHHELGHLLTTPNYAGPEFEDLYQTYSALLTPLSTNALTNADEALAEIFTAYKRGEPVDEDLLEFFNDYSISGFPDINN